jgi:hypothetical protein
MLNLALSLSAYDVDTLVADEPAEPFSRPRTVTDGAMTMQVYIEKWHRRIPTLSHTACGLRIDGQRNRVRREELTEALCPDCFTGYELELAARNNRKALEP